SDLQCRAASQVSPLLGYATSGLPVTAAAERNSATICRGAVQLTPAAITLAHAVVIAIASASVSPWQRYTSSLQLKLIHAAISGIDSSSRTSASASARHGIVSHAS